MAHPSIRKSSLTSWTPEDDLIDLSKISEVDDETWLVPEVEAISIDSYLQSAPNLILHSPSSTSPTLPSINPIMLASTPSSSRPAQSREEPIPVSFCLNISPVVGQEDSFNSPLIQLSTTLDITKDIENRTKLSTTQSIGQQMVFNSTQALLPQEAVFSPRTLNLPPNELNSTQTLPEPVVPGLNCTQGSPVPSRPHNYTQTLVQEELSTTQTFDLKHVSNNSAFKKSPDVPNLQLNSTFETSAKVEQKTCTAATTTSEPSTPMTILRTNIISKYLGQEPNNSQTRGTNTEVFKKFSKVNTGTINKSSRLSVASSKKQNSVNHSSLGLKSRPNFKQNRIGLKVLDQGIKEKQILKLDSVDLKSSIKEAKTQRMAVTSNPPPPATSKWSSLTSRLQPATRLAMPPGGSFQPRSHTVSRLPVPGYKTR